MKIFYIKKDEFLKKITPEALQRFSDNRHYKSNDKYIEHLCGIYLVKSVAGEVYNIQNPEIKIRNSKPFFENSDIFFSISHSKNIVAAVFHTCNIGFDIEYVKPRNYQKILCRYDIREKDMTINDFYKFWTVHEASIKLNQTPKSIYTASLESDYMLSCVCSEVMVSDFEIIRYR